MSGLSPFAGGFLTELRSWFVAAGSRQVERLLVPRNRSSMRRERVPRCFHAYSVHAKHAEWKSNGRDGIPLFLCTAGRKRTSHPMLWSKHIVMRDWLRLFVLLFDRPLVKCCELVYCFLMLMECLRTRVCRLLNQPK
jgi:hypothetical protein